MKPTTENADELKAEKQLQRQDECDRIPVEGKFGNCKRKGTLGRIMAKLAHTIESVIHVGIIMLNLEKYLRVVLLCLYLGSIRARRIIIAALASANTTLFTSGSISTRQSNSREVAA